MKRRKFLSPARHRKSALFVFTAVALFGIIWNSYTAYQIFKSTTERAIRMESILGSIIYYDEVLTMSARMTATTGDSAWEKRYRQYEPKLDEAINKASQILRADIRTKAAALETQEANKRLVEMENKAFLLVRQGKAEEAKTVLFSEDYDREKKIYKEGMAGFESAVEEIIDDFLTSAKDRLALTIVLSTFAGVVLLIFWVFIGRQERLQEAIGKSKQVEQALQDNQALFSGILGMAVEAIVSIDESQRVILFNKGAENVFGYSPDEILGKPIELLIPGRFRQAHSGHVKEFASGVAVVRLMGTRPELSGLRKSGEEFPAEASIIKLVIKDKLVFTVVLRDITERRRAEEVLKTNEKKLKQITDAVPSAVYRYSLDKQGVQKFLFMSRFAETLFGVPSEKIVNDFSLVWNLVLPEDAETLVRSIKVSAETLKPRAHDFKIRDTRGNLKWIEDRSIPEEPEADGTIIWNGALIDITSRKRAEWRLNAQYAVIAVLAESLDLEEAIRRIIQTICESLDWQEGAFWNVDATAGVLRCADIWHRQSDGMEEFIDATRRVAFKRNVGLPGRIWESRKPAWILDITKDSNFPRAPFAVKAGLRSAFGFPVLFEDQFIGVMEFFTREIRSPDDDLLRMMDAIGTQIGQFIRQKNLSEQLFQSQKLETVGTLTGGIAHDLNNQLTPLSGYVDLLMQNRNLDVESRGFLEEVNLSAKRCSAIVQQLLNFSRPSAQLRTVFKIVPLFKDFYKLLRPMIPANVSVEIHCEENSGAIFGNETEIQTVLMNFAVNARDAMSATGGKLSINARGVDMSAQFVKSGLSPGRYAVLSVSDTGCGMTDEVKRRIFEPFFTTKPKGKGTGLGLAMVFKIVNDHKGWVDVSTEEGKGTTFYVYLPITSEQPVKVKDAPEEHFAAFSGHGETILFADDEESLRNLAKVLLERLGYKGIFAADGEQVLKIVQASQSQISAVIMDMTMPGMAGRQILKKILEVNPRARVIVATGFTSEGSAEELLIKEGAAGFIQKPYTILPLAKMIHNVLARA